MHRSEAYELLTKYISNKNLLKHSLADEATMRGIYRHLHPKGNINDEEKWGITGLLHDIDYQLAQETNQLDKHGSLIFEKETAIPDDIAQAIQAHNFEGTRVLPKTSMDWAIAIADGLTGFVVACALVRPEKTLAVVTPEIKWSTLFGSAICCASKIVATPNLSDSFLSGFRKTVALSLIYSLKFGSTLNFSVICIHLLPYH